MNTGSELEMCLLGGDNASEGKKGWHLGARLGSQISNNTANRKIERVPESDSVPYDRFFPKASNIYEHFETVSQKIFNGYHA